MIIISIKVHWKSPVSYFVSSIFRSLIILIVLSTHQSWILIYPSSNEYHQWCEQFSRLLPIQISQPMPRVIEFLLGMISNHLTITSRPMSYLRLQSQILQGNICHGQKVVFDLIHLYDDLEFNRLEPQIFHPLQVQLNHWIIVLMVESLLIEHWNVLKVWRNPKQMNFLNEVKVEHLIDFFQIFHRSGNKWRWFLVTLSDWSILY